MPCMREGPESRLWTSAAKAAVIGIAYGNADLAIQGEIGGVIERRAGDAEATGKK